MKGQTQQQNKKYIADIIQDDYKNWKSGDIILLTSPTGTGKTTICLKLAAYASLSENKVLYITSRTAKLNEFMYDSYAYKDDFMYITYQKLEQDISCFNIDNLNNYLKCKYIFIDECHYFTDDISMPDSNASLSEEWLRTMATSSIKIYASATADMYYKRLQAKVNIPQSNIYSITKDYSYVTGCYVYNKEDAINILNNILGADSEAKILYFINTTTRMELFLNEYGYECADYLCSSNSSDTHLRKICNLTNDDKINIGKRILFATKTIDIGVNIKDKQLKYIFCEMPDPNTIVQCLGRKRSMGADDTCEFYICNQDAKSLSLHVNKIRKHVQDYEEYKASPSDFIRKHKDDRNLNKGGSVFILTPGNANIQIDNDKLRKYKYDIKIYDYIKEHGFIEMLRNVFDSYLAKLLKEVSVEPDSDVINYLNNMKDKLLFDEDKKAVSDYFSKIIKGKHTFGLNVINEWLDKNIGSKCNIRLFKGKYEHRKEPDGTISKNYKKNFWVFR